MHLLIRYTVFSILLFTSLTKASTDFQESISPLDDKTRIIRRHYGHIKSTQKTIEQHLSDVSPHQWIMVSADSQEGGKGLWKRVWVSPPGNVFVTYAIPYDPAIMQYISMIAGVAVADTLEEYKLDPQLRWVNNVLVKGKKIAGILINLDQGIALIGIGINVSMTRDVAATIDQPVTSLLCELASPPTTEEVLNTLNRNMHKRFINVDTASVFATYDRLLAYKGKVIKVFDGDKVVEGVFKEINAEGNLILTTHQGDKKFPSGEIVPFKD